MTTPGNPSIAVRLDAHGSSCETRKGTKSRFLAVIGTYLLHPTSPSQPPVIFLDFSSWRGSRFETDTPALSKAPVAERGARLRRELGDANDETQRTNGRELWGMLTGILCRFHYMWEFLGLPWKDIELLPPGNAKAKI
jgi:hypothetical protein